MEDGVEIRIHHCFGFPHIGKIIILNVLFLLLLDSYTVEMVEKINRDINLRGVVNMKSCKVGLEVHFKEGRSCTEATNAPGRKRRRAMTCWWCTNCNSIEARS